MYVGLEQDELEREIWRKRNIYVDGCPGRAGQGGKHKKLRGQAPPKSGCLGIFNRH